MEKIIHTVVFGRCPVLLDPTLWGIVDINDILDDNDEGDEDDEDAINK